MNRQSDDKNFTTGCLFIIGCCLLTNLITFALGYLAAWLIHTL